MADPILSTKLCTACENHLDLSLFRPKKTTADGLFVWCLACEKAYKAEWYKKNVERLKVSMAARYEITRNEDNAKKRAWGAANKDIKKARAAAYNINNREKIAAKSSVYRMNNASVLKLKKAADYEKNKLHYKIKMANWMANNKEAHRIHGVNRRARVLRSGGVLSSGLASKLFKLQRGKCACCGVGLGANYHMDHINPLARGGANEDSNMQLLTRRCNLQKHASDPVEFMQSRGFLI